MCYKVKCGTCGKSTWAGCGGHVASVHAQIPEGQHCACRDWPGVEKKKEAQAAATTAMASAATAEGSAASTEAASAAQ